MKSTVEANLGAAVAAAAAAAAAASAIAAAVKGPAVPHPQRCSLEQCFYSELGFPLNSMEYYLGEIACRGPIALTRIGMDNSVRTVYSNFGKVCSLPFCTHPKIGI